MVNILIVEDEQAIANLMYKSLTDEGYQCTIAYDGRQGADLIEQNSYDLALLDIMLPEISGYELLEYIRPTGTPVIFITARSSLHDRIRGLKNGADDYIVKPFQIGELLARVEAILRRAGTVSYTHLALNKNLTKFRQFFFRIASGFKPHGIGQRHSCIVKPPKENKAIIKHTEHDEKAQNSFCDGEQL